MYGRLRNRGVRRAHFLSMFIRLTKLPVFPIYVLVSPVSVGAKGFSTERSPQNRYATMGLVLLYSITSRENLGTDKVCSRVSPVLAFLLRFFQTQVFNMLTGIGPIADLTEVVSKR